MYVVLPILIVASGAIVTAVTGMLSTTVTLQFAILLPSTVVAVIVTVPALMPLTLPY